MKTEKETTKTIITARTTVLGAVRAYLANDRCVALIGRDGEPQWVESFCRRGDTDMYKVYIITGPDMSGEDGDGTPPCDCFEVSRERQVVVQVTVHIRAGQTSASHARRVARIQKILRATHIAGQTYPGQ